MNVSILLKLKDEEIISLAKLKGRSETKWIGESNDMNGKTEVPNSIESACAHIKDVYSYIILQDVAKVVTDERTKNIINEIEQIKLIVKEEVKSLVIASIE